MSCDHELANEWAHCGGKNASYITRSFIKLSSTSVEIWSKVALEAPTGTETKVQLVKLNHRNTKDAQKDKF